MTEAEIFESVTGSGSTDFATLVDILNRHGKWCLIGGLAVNCYVEPVYTVDADVVVVSAALPAIKSELERAGFATEQFPHSLNARMPGSHLRIQLTLDPRYQQFVKRAELRIVLGLQVPVAALSDDLTRKIWAWSDDTRRVSKRKKDELDLIRILERYPEFRDAMPAEIRRQLEPDN